MLTSHAPAGVIGLPKYRLASPSTAALSAELSDAAGQARQMGRCSKRIIYPHSVTSAVVNRSDGTLSNSGNLNSAISCSFASTGAPA
jgi:hypothetical protein